VCLCWPKRLIVDQTPMHGGSRGDSLHHVVPGARREGAESPRPAWLAYGCSRLIVVAFATIDPRWTETENEKRWPDRHFVAENRAQKSVCRTDTPVARCGCRMGHCVFFWLFHLLIWAWYELFGMRRLPITQPVPENRAQARLPGFRVRCCSARFSSVNGGVTCTGTTWSSSML